MPARLCLALLLVSACGPSVVGPNGDGDGDGDGDGPGGDFDPFPEDCGAQTEAIGARNVADPPDLLVVVDRSTTMDTPIDPRDPYGPTRLDAMGASLASVAASYDENIHFGLSVFPSDDGCYVAPGTDVPIAAGTAGALGDTFSALEAGGLTPAHLALENAAAVYADRAVNPAGRYVLLATDGLPNCGGNQDAAALTLQAIRDLAARGIATFVLGFGSPSELPTQFLDEAALAGGVPHPEGPPYFYFAADDIELDGALSAIAGGAFIPSCSYALDSAPPDPELVTVTIDGVAVPRDPSREVGWDYAPDDSTITFFGPACDLIEGGGARQVSFVYGCPGPVVD